MDRRTFLYTLAASGGIGMAHLANAMSPEPLFHVRAEIKNGQLLIHYEVENPSPRDLYLFTRVVTREVDGHPRIEEVPGVRFDPENRALRIDKLPDFGWGTRLYLAFRANVTPVRAGKRFEDTVSVILPAREFSQGVAPAEACRRRSSTYRGLRFTIDYQWSHPLVRESSEKIGGEEVIGLVFPEEYIFDEVLGGRLTSPLVPLDIPVIECIPN